MYDDMSDLLEAFDEDLTCMCGILGRVLGGVYVARLIHTNQNFAITNIEAIQKLRILTPNFMTLSTLTS